MSTVMAASVCFFHDPDAFIEANRTIYADMYENRFCKEKNEYKNMKELFTKNNMTEKESANWTFVAIVREPIDRFVSGYVDKCLLEKKRQTSPGRCYGCAANNVQCFVDRLYNRAMRYSRGQTRVQSYEDIHFFPQNWHCNFNHFFSKFRFIRFKSPLASDFGEMIEELVDLFTVQKIPAPHMHRVIHALTYAQTQHSTTDSAQRKEVEKEIRNNRSLLRKLIRIFFFDYVLFGFPFPQ